MKLHDWAIQEAIKRHDWLSAVNAVCDRFGLPKYAANSKDIASLVISEKIYSNVPEQIRIISEGKAYTWMAGDSLVHECKDPVTARIRIWTDYYEAK